MAKAHSILGASSAHRWLACPGSVRLSAGIPRTSSTYADEGTAAHELAEMCLRTNVDAAQHIGTFITVNSNAYEVTEEMANAVQVYLDVVREDLAAAGPGAGILVEQKFHLDWLYDGLFGTNDAMVLQPFGTLRVYDFKYGAGVAVEADANSQMMYYGLGAAHGDAYEDVELIIVQPRAQHSDGPVRRSGLTTDELTRWGREILRPGAQATEDPNAPLCSGSHCKFCPAMAICPEQKTRAMAVAKEAFTTPAQPPVHPASMTPADLKKVLDAADMVEAWLNACRAHVRTLLETGMATTEELGYKLVAGRATRKWADENEAEKWLITLLEDEAYTRKLLSPSQAEKLLKGVAKKALEPMVTTTRGTQLAPASDKREAIAPAISAFTEVEI